MERVHSPGIAGSCTGCYSRMSMVWAGRGCNRRHLPSGQTCHQCALCWSVQDLQTAWNGSLKHQTIGQNEVSSLASSSALVLCLKMRKITKLLLYSDRAAKNLMFFISIFVLFSAQISKNDYIKIHLLEKQNDKNKQSCFIRNSSKLSYD